MYVILQMRAINQYIHRTAQARKLCESEVVVPSKQQMVDGRHHSFSPPNNDGDASRRGDGSAVKEDANLSTSLTDASASAATNSIGETPTQI